MPLLPPVINTFFGDENGDGFPVMMVNTRWRRRIQQITAAATDRNHDSCVMITRIRNVCRDSQALLG
jgi:hypothetical protein